MFAIEDTSSRVTDRVTIEGLYVEAIIGFYHWEHEEAQPLVLDITMGTNFDAVFESDALEHALDYHAISRRVKKYCQESKVHLLEYLAGGILKLLFTHYPVTDVELKIRKPHALRDAVPSVTCYRTREQMGIEQISDS
ncbi:dihydroneopterin aldolase [Endozoicomonadaceae bacterium StTr2]